MALQRFAQFIALLALALCVGCSGSQPTISVAVSPTTASVLLGNSQSFTANVTGTANTAVTWSVNGVPGGDASVGTISAAGVYTSPVRLPASAGITISATSAADPAKSGAAAITVTSDVAVAVTATPADTGVIVAGSSVALTVTVTSSGKPDTSVTWSVNGVTGGNGTVGLITATGASTATYTAPPTAPTPNLVTIKAISAADISRSATLAEAIASEYVYVANSSSNDISAYRVNASTGALTAVAGAPFAAGNQPKALALVSGKFLFSANYNDGHLGTTGNVSAYSIDPITGALAPVVGSPFTAGLGPESIAADPAGKFLYVANFWSANISAYSINPVSGALTPVAGSPFGAGGNFYALTVDPLGKFAYVSDNSFPTVRVFPIDAATGALTTGVNTFLGWTHDPLGLAVHPSGKYLYVADWLGANTGNVLAYSTDKTTGALTALADSPYAIAAGPQPVVLDPAGKFLYVGGIQATTGPVLLGFSVDPSTGSLAPLANSPFTCPNPLFLALDPLGKFLFVGPYFSAFSVYVVDSNTGALAPAPGSPYNAGAAPSAVAVTLSH